MNRLQWFLIAIGAILIWLNSSFPPRHSVGRPNDPAGRAFLLSSDFGETDVRPFDLGGAIQAKITSYTFRSVELDHNRRDYWNITICMATIFFVAAVGAVVGARTRNGSRERNDPAVRPADGA